MFQRSSFNRRIEEMKSAVEKANEDEEKKKELLEKEQELQKALETAKLKGEGVLFSCLPFFLF